VLDLREDIVVEVIASRYCASVWRRDPRIEVIPPRPWPEHSTATARQPLDILLAPLLPTAANLARSDTKRIDACRSGAALLVSEADIYRPSAEESALGMVVLLEPAAWQEAILAMVSGLDRRRTLARLNRECVIAGRENKATVFARESADLWSLSRPSCSGARIR